MADSNTTNLALLKMEPGSHENTWGAEMNSNLDDIDSKFGDVTEIEVTGGSVTLTAAEQRANAIRLTGTLVADETVNFNATGGTWIISNETLGSFTVTAKVTGQTGIVLSSGKQIVVIM